MIYLFLLLIFFIFICLFLAFIFRPEKRYYPLISLSALFCIYFSEIFFIILSLFSIVDYLAMRNIFTKKMKILLNLSITVFSYYLFYKDPLILNIGVLKFNILHFSLMVLFFNRLNDDLNERVKKNIRTILLSNFFFPRLLTPVISNFDEEARFFKDEHHFQIGSFIEGAKKIVFGIFIVLCILIPGGRFLGTVSESSLFVFSKGLLFLCFIYSIYNLGAGCLELFNYRVYRNFNSPLVPSGFIDFWKRWCVTFYNFSKSIQNHAVKKPNNFLTVLISLLVQFIYFHSFLSAFEFFSSMLLLLLTSKIFNSSIVFKKITYREKFLGYFLKLFTIILIILSFGASFKLESEPFIGEYLDIGSLIIFFMSCFFLFIYHYQQKRNNSIFELLPSSKTITAGVFILYVMMFGDFL